MAADDGIVLRVPAMDDEPPGAELFAFEPEEIEDLVTAQVGNSALFASRFRECAARALLLPRTNPAKRTPLWQQRQRSAQLLDVARKYPDFPIILETVRECLNDVYDLPSLKNLLALMGSRGISVREVQTRLPSPFAQSLLFGYVAQFLYEGDSPLAERRAAALSLDPALLNELLGRTELRELLDAQVILRTEAELQRLAPGRQLAGMEGAADLLRMLGPLGIEAVAARLRDETEPERDRARRERASRDRARLRGRPAWPICALVETHLQGLVRANRALEVRLGGGAVFAAIEDAPRLRDGLGVPLPHGVPLAFIDPVEDPVGDLVSRFARTHGPFTAADVAAALGLGVAVAKAALDRLVAENRVMTGAFRPAELLAEDAAGFRSAQLEYCEAGVLRMIRSRSLAALRAEVEPVDQPTFARFLPAWQGIGQGLSGIDGVLAVVEQLAGVPVPASAIESFVLPVRVRNYAPGMLDELMSAGEVLVSGAGALAGTDGWVALHTAENAPLSLPQPDRDHLGALARRLLVVLDAGGAYFVPQLARLVAGVPDPAAVPSIVPGAHEASGTEPRTEEVLEALWELFWAGAVSPDTLAPVRGLLSGGKSAHRAPALAPRARTARLGRMAMLRQGRAGFEAPGAGDPRRHAPAGARAGPALRVRRGPGIGHRPLGGAAAPRSGPDHQGPRERRIPARTLRRGDAWIGRRRIRARRLRPALPGARTAGGGGPCPPGLLRRKARGRAVLHLPDDRQAAHLRARRGIGDGSARRPGPGGHRPGQPLRCRAGLAAGTRRAPPGPQGRGHGGAVGRAAGPVCGARRQDRPRFRGGRSGGKHARHRGRRARCGPAPGRHREACGAQGQRRTRLRFTLGCRITTRWILFHPKWAAV